MNCARLKYKSFFYSLAIHLVIGIIALSMYLKEDEKHEVYSLINLKSMQICAPDISKPLVKERVKAKKPPPLKKQLSRPVKKTSKPMLKPKIVQKSIPVLAKATKEVVIIKPEHTETLDKPEAKEEVQEVRAEKEVLIEEQPPLVSVSEPKISYEVQYIQDNIALINALIKKNLSYPRLAKKRGLQGKAMVSFTLNLEGEVLDIKALGTLSSILKKSAIKTVKKASSSFPKPSQVLALRIPIVYKLH